MKWKPRSIAARAIAIGVLVLSTMVVAGSAPAAFANGSRNGEAVPTNPGTNTPVTSGGSSTAWTLNLPAQSACRGDTASQGYHVYSFIVPATVDPGTLTFNPSTGPSTGNPLVTQVGSAYIAANTAQSTGQVVNIPTFNFNLFASTDQGGTKIATPPGVYKVGIACANTTGGGDKYWSTLITFTADGGDPNGEVWANPGAAVIPNGCKSSTTPGAEMGMYPAWGGSQSYLRIACIFNHSTGGSGDFASNVFTIHDFSTAVYHNGAGRTFNTAGVGAGVTAIPVTDCQGALAWVNRSITGTGIAARTIVTSITGGCAPGGTLNLNKVTSGVVPAGNVLVENSQVRADGTATVQSVSPMVCDPQINFTTFDTTNTLSIDGTDFDPGTTIVNAAPVPPGCVNTSPPPIQRNPGPGPDTNQLITVGGTMDGSGLATTVGVSTNRTIDDGVVVNAATNTLTSTAARFFNTDIGLRVSGPGVAAACYIASRTNTVATLTPLGCAPANAGACPPNPQPSCTYTIGEPSFTAPQATDTVLNQGVQLPLSPTLVGGSQPCAADNASGFGIEGTWLAPGSFTNPATAFATQPPGTRAIAEILFKTSVVSYAGWVVEQVAGAETPIPGYHFNLVFPNVPTGLALCPSTATSPGLGFSIGVNGTTASQAQIANGFGRPATAQLRSTRSNGNLSTGINTTTFITDDVSGPGVKWITPDFNRLCSLPAGTPNINFACGDG